MNPAHSQALLQLFGPVVMFLVLMGIIIGNHHSKHEGR